MSYYNDKKNLLTSSLSAIHLDGQVGNLQSYAKELHSALAEKDAEIQTLRELISGKKGIEELYKARESLWDARREVKRLRSVLAKKEQETKQLQQEMQAQGQEIQRLRAALEKAERFVSNIMSFYGEGLEVHNWHQNGQAEPWDSFFDSNMDGDELDVLRTALSQPTGGTSHDE